MSQQNEVLDPNVFRLTIEEMRAIQELDDKILIMSSRIEMYQELRQSFVESVIQKRNLDPQVYTVGRVFDGIIRAR